MVGYDKLVGIRKAIKKQLDNLSMRDKEAELIEYGNSLFDRAVALTDIFTDIDDNIDYMQELQKEIVNQIEVVNQLVA